MEETFDHLIGEEKEEVVSQSRFARLGNACGWRFLVFLFFSQFACKGFLMITIKNIMLPLFRNRVDASTLQIFVMVSMIPWSIKPLIGLCSDYILIFGYHKRGWLVISLVFGSVSSIILFFQDSSNPYVLVICFVGINFEIALYDLLSEGKYAEIRRENKDLGSDLTTFTQVLQTSGQLAGTCLVGFLSDLNMFGVLYVLTLVFCVIPIVPTLLGFLPEERKGSGVFRFSPPEGVKKETIIIIIFCGLSGLVVSLLTTLIPSPTGPFIGMGVSIIFLSIILYGSHKAFSSYPLITAVALYQVVTNLSSPVVGSELDYFYTATPECLPNGPHFSYAYYISYTGIVGTGVALFGTLIYHFFLSRLRFRPVLLITTLLVCLAGLSDLFIVSRLNISLGIPDKVAYMVGEAVLEPLLSTLNWIPVSALITLSAPEGMEASCFAFLAGLSNFSRMVSELSGSIVINFTTTGASNCDFSSLWWLVLTCHISFPLVIGVLATWLVPDMSQEESI